MQGRVAYGTLQDQMRALRLFEKFIGGSKILHKIRPREAEAFISHRLRSGVSTGTANKDIRTLQSIFHLAIEPGGYSVEGQNPFARLGQRKRTRQSIRYVTVEEYRQFTGAAERLWWKALVSIGYGSDLRRNEILNLTWADIDFERQWIHVNPKRESANMIEWEPKDHELRVVPMPDETVQLLANIQAEAQEEHSYIFISPKRLERIKQREKAGKWNSRSEIVNSMRKNFTKSDVSRVCRDSRSMTFHIPLSPTGRGGYRCRWFKNLPGTRISRQPGSTMLRWKLKTLPQRTLCSMIFWVTVWETDTKMTLFGDSRQITPPRS